jgi:transcriptional regulator with XRE-family HTH domain
VRVRSMSWIDAAAFFEADREPQRVFYVEAGRQNQRMRAVEVAKQLAGEERDTDMAVGIRVEPGNQFAALLEGFRTAAGLSRNRLAGLVGVDPSYLTRCAHGDREPPRRHIVESIARALRLPLFQSNQLLTSAGYTPRSINDWLDVHQAVTDVMTDDGLTEEDREEYRRTILSVSRRWMPR